MSTGPTGRRFCCRLLADTLSGNLIIADLLQIVVAQVTTQGCLQRQDAKCKNNTSKLALRGSAWMPCAFSSVTTSSPICDTAVLMDSYSQHLMQMDATLSAAQIMMKNPNLR